MIFHAKSPGLEGFGIESLGQFDFFRGQDAHHAIRVNYGKPFTFGQARSHRLFPLQIFLGNAKQFGASACAAATEETKNTATTTTSNPTTTLDRIHLPPLL